MSKGQAGSGQIESGQRGYRWIMWGAKSQGLEADRQTVNRETDRQTERHVLQKRKHKGNNWYYYREVGNM